jgi:hypothetical protein
MPLSCTIPGYNQQSRHYGEGNAGAVGGDEPLACQQPFNTLPKLPTDPKQDLRPSLHLAVFQRGDRVLLIPIAPLNPSFLPVTSHGKRARTPGLTTSLLQPRANPRSDANRALLSSGYGASP